MKTVDETMKGCEHDGSYIPVNEVKRLMNEYAYNYLSAFITQIKTEFPDQNWEYLDFIADRARFTHLTHLKTREREN